MLGFLSANKLLHRPQVEVEQLIPVTAASSATIASIGHRRPALLVLARASAPLQFAWTPAHARTAVSQAPSALISRTSNSDAAAATPG